MNAEVIPLNNHTLQCNFMVIHLQADIEHFLLIHSGGVMGDTLREIFFVKYSSQNSTVHFWNF